MYVQYTFVFFFNFDSIASKNFHIIFIPLDAGFGGSQDTYLKLYLKKIENNNISYFYEPGWAKMPKTQFFLWYFHNESVCLKLNFSEKAKKIYTIVLMVLTFT